MPADPTDQAYLRTRLARVFGRRALCDAHGLRYRLGEAGPLRYDDRALQGALKVLESSVALMPPRLGLYADPTCDPADIAAAAADALATLTDLAACDHEATFASVVRAVVSALRARASIEIGPTAAPALLAGGHSLLRPSALVRVRRTANAKATKASAAVSLVCWVTSELPWIYPDDPRLWHLLAVATEEGAIPLVIARAVSPVLFPFCKALGGLALQYYLPPLPADAPADLPGRLDAIGWPPLRWPPNLEGHPVLRQIRGTVKRLVATPAGERVPPGGVDAIRDGVARGFAAGRIDVDDFVAWAESAPAPLPSRWVEGLAAWARPDAGERPPKAGRSDAATGGATQRMIDADAAPGAGSLDDARPKTTIVTRGLVTAEVDRETWDAALAKLEREELPQGRDDRWRAHRTQPRRGNDA